MQVAAFPQRVRLTILIYDFFFSFDNDVYLSMFLLYHPLSSTVYTVLNRVFYVLFRFLVPQQGIQIPNIILLVKYTRIYGSFSFSSLKCKNTNNNHILKRTGNEENQDSLFLPDILTLTLKLSFPPMSNIFLDSYVPK